MRLLYLCYWGIEEGLTHATVFPQLAIMADKQEFDSIILCTIERSGIPVSYHGPTHDKIQFHPLYSKGLTPGVFNKIFDFVLFPNTLRKIAQNNRIDFILSRGAPAGSLAWKVYKRTGIPFGVESFEPHADYMLESGVWKKNGLRYRAQKHWEEKQKRDAQFLITVSHNYRHQLIKEGLAAEKVYTIPCTVDINSFAFSKSLRDNTRKRLGLNNETIVGVYVGKFGDIYYDDEAFRMMKEAFDFFGHTFFMLILTPQTKSKINSSIHKEGLLVDRFFIDCVPHEHIPNYLSAADFAFSFVKPSPSRQFCSPIKDGEYWAAGLPIIMGEGIGDDSQLNVEHPHAGFVIDQEFTNLTEGLTHIQSLISPEARAATRTSNLALAERERGRRIINEVLNTLFLG